MSTRIMKKYYKLNIHRSGLKKRFLSMNDHHGTVTFCYCEKGFKKSGESSLVFIHGFTGNKYSWLSVIKDIPDSIHCIAIDMPGHGETVGFNEEHLVANTVVDKVKELFEKLNLTEPVCLIGTSMGGSIVALFATKYPSYVSMICLLAPVPPGKEYETEIVRQLRAGTYKTVLPETRKEVYVAADALSMKTIHLRRVLARAFLKSRLPMLDQHKILLKSAFENDYPNLGQYYAQLRNLSCPVLIIWGRQDQLCAVEGASYFFNLIPQAELVIFDECGHMIMIDKPKETTNNIIHFWNNHRSTLARL